MSGRSYITKHPTIPTHGKCGILVEEYHNPGMGYSHDMCGPSLTGCGKPARIIMMDGKCFAGHICDEHMNQRK